MFPWLNFTPPCYVQVKNWESYPVILVNPCFSIFLYIPYPVISYKTYLRDFFFRISHGSFFFKFYVQPFFPDIQYTKNVEKFHVAFFGGYPICKNFRKFLCTVYFLGYKEIPYPNNFNCTHLSIFLGIFYISKLF